MACKTNLALVGHYAEACGLWMTGEGISFQDRLHQRVRCLYCDTDLVAGSLAAHIQVQIGVVREDIKDPLHTPRTRPGIIRYPPLRWNATFLERRENAWGGKRSAAHSGYTLCTATCETW